MLLSIRSILLTCMTFLAQLSYGQSSYIDSLRQRLSDATLKDSARMELRINFANALAADSPVQARQHYIDVYESARKAGTTHYQAMAMSGLGKLMDIGKTDSALYYFQLADSLFAITPTTRAKESRATNKVSIGTLLNEQGHHEVAITSYLDAIDIMEDSDAYNKWLSIGVIYSNIGSVYHTLKQFEKALSYDLKAKEAYQQYTADPSYAVIACLYLAGDYKNLNRLPEAKKEIEEAERLASPVKSADLSYRLHDAWASYYLQAGEHLQSIRFYQLALAHAVSSGSIFRQMNANRMLGAAYIALKQFATSEAYLEKALGHARSLQNKAIELATLKNLATATSGSGNTAKAVRYYQDFIQLSDSLNQKETQRAVSEIETRYQAEKKQDSIATLQKTGALQQLQLRQKTTQNVALLVTAALLLLVAGLIYNQYRNKNRFFQQQHLIHQQQVVQLENEKKILAAQSMMKGQEEERSRLARDLHDGVGGLLSGVRLSMSTMIGNVFMSPESARSFERVITQLDQSITELRRVSHNMMPEALIKYGLKEALENYCENLDASGNVRVQLQTYGLEQRMEQSTEIVIYRIVQELLNNVIKHAAANFVLVQLVREGNRFNLTVEDNGKGFDSTLANDGSGIANIQARIDYLNGSMDIRSKPGEGTSVHLEGECG